MDPGSSVYEAFRVVRSVLRKRKVEVKDATAAENLCTSMQRSPKKLFCAGNRSLETVRGDRRASTDVKQLFGAMPWSPAYRAIWQYCVTVSGNAAVPRTAIRHMV
jgi:hypothetical protein